MITSQGRRGIQERVRLYTACPPSRLGDARSYLRDIAAVAEWSEACGCTGSLVYADNSLVDPWLVAQAVICRTRTLRPLVAVQPVYMHPYAVAKLVASLAFLHGRAVDLNMVAGGFRNDLRALNDPTPHDQRYARLVEYASLLLQLLRSQAPVTLRGDYYAVHRLTLAPPLPPALAPRVFVSGSSPAGLAAARAIGATAVKYPKRASEEARSDTTDPAAVRLGVITRPDDELAWRTARARFPEDRAGRLTRQLATAVSDSVWHRQLSALSADGPAGPYWLVPFETYQTMCPYLVGSYDVVAAELARYVGLGYRTFLLDVPPSREDLEHTTRAFARALEPLRVTA